MGSQGNLQGIIIHYAQSGLSGLECHHAAATAGARSHVATQSGTAAFTRSLLRIGKGAQVTLVESFVAAAGAQSYQVHDAVVLWAGDDTQVQHVRLVEDARDASNISTAIVTLGAKTQFNSFNMTSGSALSRYQGFLRFGGEGAHAAINGVNLLNDRQHGDTTLVLDHMIRIRYIMEYK